MTVLGKRRFLGLLLIAWAPFVVRAVQVYVAANFQQASFLAPKAETFFEFLGQQGVFVFFITIYRRRRVDRQRSAGQCPSGLPVEAAHAR